ncbi:hypothetical protein [Buttiauxella noackiae]|uniref:hypothetical protein n=1 Tax=Buttiauxella noackiae TaxID=82992 RepID=UPI00054D3B6D|nr:hypothetical protein [Buttiauxella noackiae]
MEPNYLFLPVYDAVKETGYAFTIDGQQLAKHYAEDTELNIFCAIPNIATGLTAAVRTSLCRFEKTERS